MPPRIPESFIDDLLARVDIVDIIDASVPLKKAGRDFTARCPFHDEKTPSFTVSRTKQFFHCFGCGAHGSAIGFMMDYHNMEFTDAIAELANIAGIEVPGQHSVAAPSHQADYALLEKVTDFFQAQLLKHPAATQARDYLINQRGLDDALIQEFRLGFAPPGWSHLLDSLGKDPQQRKLLVRHGLLVEKTDGKQYDRFRQRIIFPIRDQRGRPIGFGGRVLSDADQPKYLNSPETPLFHKGKELFGLYDTRQAGRKLEQLLVVEGYMDVLALARHNVRNAVATLGTATTAEHICRLFRTCQDVIFCFDGDRAGQQAAWRALEAALPEMKGGNQAFFMFLPDGEDPDSLVKTQGKQGFDALSAKSVSLSNFFFEHLSSQADITSVDGKARFLELARPLLSNLPMGAFKEILMTHIADKLRIPHGQFAAVLQDKSGLNRPPAGHTGQQPRPQRNQQSRSISLIRKVISMIVQHPELALQTRNIEHLDGLSSPGISLLRQLILQVQDEPRLSCAALLERYRGTKEGEFLASLAKQPILLPEKDLQNEFSDAIQRLYARCVEIRTEQLLDKAHSMALNPAEKTELNKLLDRGTRKTSGFQQDKGLEDAIRPI